MFHALVLWVCCCLGIAGKEGVGGSGWVEEGGVEASALALRNFEHG